MAHAKKPELVFQRNGQFHLNWQSFHFIRLLAAEVCASAVVMLDTPCSEVECKTTGNTLHSHVSSSSPLSCITMCLQVSTELYLLTAKRMQFTHPTTIPSRWISILPLWLCLQSSLLSSRLQSTFQNEYGNYKVTSRQKLIKCSLFFRPTNAEHIYIYSAFLHYNVSYILRCICTIFKESYFLLSNLLHQYGYKINK